MVDMLRIKVYTVVRSSKDGEAGYSKEIVWSTVQHAGPQLLIPRRTMSASESLVFFSVAVSKRPGAFLIMSSTEYEFTKPITFGSGITTSSSPASAAPASESTPCDGQNICTIVLGTIVIGVLVVCLLPKNTPGSASWCGGVFARLSQEFTSTEDAHMSKELNAIIGESKFVTNATPTTSKSASDVSDSEKAATATKMVSKVSQLGDAVVMYWAPWCQHCRNALPAVVDAAEKSGTNLVLANYELLPKSAIDGSEGLNIAVQFFPYIVNAKTRNVFGGPFTSENTQAWMVSGAAQKETSTEEDDAAARLQSMF